MAAGSAFGRIAPPDGDAFFISRMKRAPRLASAASKLRRVRFARERSASIDTPSNRSPNSTRLAAAIFPRTPIGSATASLNVAAKHLTRLAGQQRVPRFTGRIFQCRSVARRLEKRRGVEDDDVVVGLGPAAGEKRAEPRRILLRITTGHDVQGRAFEASVLGRDLELRDRPVRQAQRAGFAVKRDLVEA